MRLSFIYPIFLWLLLLLPLLWAFTLATRDLGIARLGALRFWSVLALRSIALAALVLALAGIQIVRPVQDLTLVFLVDGSDSVAPAQRDAALEYINAALAERPPGDRAAVVLFGENALVERAPADLDALGRLSSTVVAGRTNIEEAIQLGLALFPADSQKRLMLLSDGQENSGRAAAAARLAASRGIPLDVVALPGVRGSDVLVSDLSAPDVAREGQDVTIQARIESDIATEGRLEVFANNELVATRELEIEPGSTDVPITVPGGTAGFSRYEVRLEARDDARALNNRAAAFTNVQGPPRVLLVATEPERAAALQSVLAAGSVRVELREPQQVSVDPVELEAYAAIVLVDVPASAVPAPLQGALPVYVEQQGGSLAMIGGFDAYGAGGWRRTPIAEILPVELDPRDREERPDLALALVIDRSGSMAAEVANGLTQLDLAKEAVYQASFGLAANDQLGIVVFDSAAQWILEMQQLPSIIEIEQALSMISDGGGTDIRSGIEPAAQALATADARTKHVILLTDGVAGSNYADLIRQMRDNQVTITVVSIGDDANPALDQIADIGGGRFYQVLSIRDVPQIFLAETIAVAGRDIVEETFTPQIALNAAPIRGLGGLPPLHGHNGAETRPLARTILVSPEGKPILAQWQYGLGQVLAWTSDFKGQWARDWIAWPQFPRFAGALLDTLLPPEQADNLALSLRNVDAQAIIELNVSDEQGQPIDSSQIEARLLDPNGEGNRLNFSQVEPGRYRATTEADTPGVYLAQVAVSDRNGNPLGTVSGGLAVSYSPEYRRQAQAGTLLPDLAAITGGRVAPPPAESFAATAQPVGEVREIALPLLWLALLLWPLDIALRRLMLRPTDLNPALERIRERLRPAPADSPAADPTLERLQMARERARRPFSRPAKSERTAPPAAQAEQSSPETAPRRPEAAPPQPEPTPKTEPAQDARSDDPLASVLAARQRARRQRREEKG